MELKDKFDKTADAPPEKANMVAFVKEWLHDRNGKNAALRIGISPIYADHVAKYFLEHPYVQNLIKEEEGRAAAIMSDPELMKGEIVKNLLSILKNDNESLKASERIQAAKMLTDLLSLAPKQQTQDDNKITNIMIVPPSIPVDEWSAVAQKSQEDLRLKLEQSL